MRRHWMISAALAMTGGIGLASRAFEVVPTASAAIIERFGRCSRTLEPGLRVVIPFVDTVRMRVDPREQTVPFPLRVVSMHDGTDLPIEFTIQYSVTDAAKAVYGTASYIQALERHAVYELTYALANLPASDARVSLQQIAESVLGVLRPRTARWGLTLHELLLTVGEVTTTEVKDEARVAAQHDGASAQIFTGHMTMNVLPHGHITHQANGRLESMSTWNIDRQEISGGNVQQGDGNHQFNSPIDPASATKAREVVADLLSALRTSAQERTYSSEPLIADAEVIEGELTAAQEEDREPDAGLLRRTWLHMRTSAEPAAIAVAGSATASLVTQLGHLFGVA